MQKLHVVFVMLLKKEWNQINFFKSDIQNAGCKASWFLTENVENVFSLKEIKLFNYYLNI